MSKKSKSDWGVCESEVTPEHLYKNRRQFMKDASIAMTATCSGKNHTIEIVDFNGKPQ